MLAMEEDTTAGKASVSPVPVRGRYGRLRQLGRDYGYVLPGLPLAAISFAVLVGFTVASLVTVIAWIGALLMPLTLMIASAFARLSRLRLRAWGTLPAPVEYRPAGQGLRGVVQVVTEPRRWLDLAFETLIALPLRLLTFMIATIWTGIALGGVTYWIWWRFVPTDALAVMQLVSLGSPGPVLRSDRGLVLLDSGLVLLLGVVFLLTLPMVMSGLARSDAALTTTLLGGAVPPRSAHDRSADEPANTADLPHSAFDGTGWVWVSTSFVAVILVIIGWPVLAAVHGSHPAVALGLTVSHSAASVLALRSARAGIALAMLAAAGTMLETSNVAAASPWPWPVTAMLAQCLLVAIVALRYRWPWAVGAWSLSTLLTVVALAAVTRGIPDAGIANGLVLISVTAGVAVLGVLARLWRESAGRAQQAEEFSAAEIQRRRHLEERNRIARELHDVVAHSMSVINVQASTAQYRKAGINAAVQQEFDDIAHSSRQALGEMRALLAVLRDDTAAPTAPVPTLADIPDLVEATRASGAIINYSVVSDAPPTVGLTAYRAIQEALSNALRHAPGATIKVRTAIDREDNAMVVEVLNSAPERDGPAAPGSGLGLAGITERVSALGGTVEAGSTPDGGFRVLASLPLDTSPDGHPDVQATEVGGGIGSPG